MDGLLASLQLVGAGVLIFDRRLGGSAGDVVDQDASRRRDGLQPAGRVDGIAQHHALALVSQLYGRASRQDPGPDPQVGQPDLLAQAADHLRQRQPRPGRTLGVVLTRHGRAPYGHDRIPDELLHGPAIALDQYAAALEIQAEQLADLLRIAMFGQRRKAHEIGKEHRHQPALGDGSRRLPGGRGVPPATESVQQSGPALPAEAVRRIIRGSARGAPKLQRRPAPAAEPAARTVLGAASRAINGCHGVTGGLSQFGAGPLVSESSPIGTLAKAAGVAQRGGAAGECVK